jgi:membrane protease YdiL (CAAX protease family)
MKHIRWLQIVQVRWNPNKDLGMVFVSIMLVIAGLYTATNIVGTNTWGGIAYFILYAVLTALGFGVGIPIYWTVVVRKRPISSLGLTTNWLWLSLGLQLVFAVVQYFATLAKTGIPNLNIFFPLLVLSLTIGLFEAIFWRGWVLLRLEESFGFIPAILLGSVLYAAYHIGYGMSLNEMVFLFFIGLFYGSIFRLTKSVFLLWPLLQPMGQLVTLLKDGLELPILSSLGFAEVLIAMLVIIWLADKYSKKSCHST